MPATKEQRDAAIKLLRDGLRDGTVTVTIAYTCGWCCDRFSTMEAHDAHLVDGKTIDPLTGRLRRICPRYGTWKDGKRIDR